MHKRLTGPKLNKVSNLDDTVNNLCVNKRTIVFDFVKRYYMIIYDI